MGKQDNYISYKCNSSIVVDNYAAIMQAFGYALVAVPADDVPAGALVVDPGDVDQRDNADVLEAMRAGIAANLMDAPVQLAVREEGSDKGPTARLACQSWFNRTKIKLR